MALPKPPNLHAPAPPPGADPLVHSETVAAELAALRGQFDELTGELASLRWARDRRFIGVVVVGLFPVLAQVVFSSNPPAISFCLGIYFSALWALFFYSFFSPAGVTRNDSIGAFLATSIISVVVLFGLVALGFGRLRDPYVTSAFFPVRMGANILAVGLPAELCKAAVILFYLRRASGVVSVPAMVFYGLMSGLGFGVYEGMAGASPAGSEDTDSTLRLVTLPFFDATWAAIGAYLWTLGQLCPARRYPLWAAALLVPAVLDGLHATWADSLPWASLVIDAVSVVALMIYLCRGTEEARVRQPDGSVIPPLPVTPA